MNEQRRVCFVISPMGDERSSTRARADYVLNTYITPACARTGYDAVRADHDEVADMARGITSAVQNAPMVISFLGAPVCGTEGCRGAPFWNANVMIETGSRVASRLPLVLLCDRDSSGALPKLPFTLQSWKTILLPGPDGVATSPIWIDSNPEPTVKAIAKQIETERKRLRLLDCKHPLASINATSRDSDLPDSLLYTAASEHAEDLFGIKDDDEPKARLVGRNMAEFLEGLRRRMHPFQWKMFRRDQKDARNQLSQRNPSTIASVPIVLEPDGKDDAHRRAYLPVIVQEFQRDREGESNWYNLRVLYLDVTSVTERQELPNGKDYYVCKLNPSGGRSLQPLTPFEGIRAFVSYTREEAAQVAEEFLFGLKQLAPYVNPFIDTGIAPGMEDITVLTDRMTQAEIFFVLLSAGERGPGQQAEIKYLNGRILNGKAPVIVPVMLDDSRPMSMLDQYEWIKSSQLDEDRVKDILLRHFPDRCADEWMEETAEVTAQ